MKNTERIGIVSNTKLNKTITISIQRRFQHNKYKKNIVQLKHYLVHDENNMCNCGDLVLITRHKPFSKKKHWLVKKILSFY